MKVSELIDKLSEFSPVAELRLLHQPNSPLEFTLGGVVAESEIRAHEGEELADDEPEVVYLLEGSQIGYGRKVAWEVSD